MTSILRRHFPDVINDVLKRSSRSKVTGYAHFFQHRDVFVFNKPTGNDCDAWFGHSETIFRNHYTQVTENHFKAARQRASATPQITPQQASETGEHSGTEKQKDSEQKAKSPFSVEGYGSEPKSEEIGGSSKWPMRDSNLMRLPAGKQGFRERTLRNALQLMSKTGQLTPIWSE